MNSLRNGFLMKTSEWDEWIITSKWFSDEDESLDEMRWMIHFEMVSWWKRVNEMNVSLRNSFLMKMNLWMKWIYLQMKTDEWIRNSKKILVYQNETEWKQINTKRVPWKDKFKKVYNFNIRCQIDFSMDQCALTSILRNN